MVSPNSFNRVGSYPSRSSPRRRDPGFFAGTAAIFAKKHLGSRFRGNERKLGYANASARKVSSSLRCRLIRPAAVEAEAGRPT